MPSLRIVIGCFLVLIAKAWTYQTVRPAHPSPAALSPCATLRKYSNSQSALLMAKERDNDLSSRRRKRRSRAKTEVEPSLSTDLTSSSTPNKSRPTERDNSEDKKNALPDDIFGVSESQLRDLNAYELPVPRENILTKKEMKKEESNKGFQLLDLKDFIKEVGTVDDQRKREKAAAEKAQLNKVDRRNSEEYLKLFQANPFADADENLFVQEEEDAVQLFLGSGKILNIPVPYLQTGHSIILVVCLLSAFVYAPGNPLTEFPEEIRSFLQKGLLMVYSINFVLAVQGYFRAKEKFLPAIPWAIRTFILGGIAAYELKQMPAKSPQSKKSRS